MDLYEIDDDLTLTLALPGWGNAEIVTRLAKDIDTFLGFQELATAYQDTPELSWETLRPMVQFFVEHVAVSWNLARSGQLLPLTVENMRHLPMPLLMQIVATWSEAMAGQVTVSAPLVETLPSGNTSPEEPEATEPE